MLLNGFFLRHNHRTPKLTPNEFDKIIGSKENTNAFIEKKLERLVYEDMQEPSNKDFKIRPGRKYVTKSPVDHSLALSPNPHRLPRIDDGIDLDFELRKARNGGVGYGYKPLTMASQEIIRNKNNLYESYNLKTEANLGKNREQSLIINGNNNNNNNVYEKNTIPLNRSNRNLNFITDDNKNENQNRYRDEVNYLNTQENQRKFMSADLGEILKNEKNDRENIDRNLRGFDKYKTNVYYGQTDFGYNQYDDKYKHYCPYREDYKDSIYGDYTYNFYLNAPMRGDKSVDWKYPPKYYYSQEYDPVKKIYIK